MEATNIAVLRFKEPLSSTEVRGFRGAIVELAGRENPCFHNHEANGLRYGYPLVQYKVIDNHVCLIGIAEAAMAVMALAGKFPAGLGDGVSCTGLYAHSLYSSNGSDTQALSSEKLHSPY